MTTATPRARRWLAAAPIALAALLALAGQAAAATPIDRSGGGGGGGGHGGGATTPGYDISYPQCGGAFPSYPAFAIVGVNGGRVFSPNPCLASQITWAGGVRGQLYANTGNPGPALSSHWPTGQTSPRYCDPANPDTADCAFDYGYNAAADSYAGAASAYGQLGLSGSPAGTRWWLDVETSNSWRSDTSLNVAALGGAVTYLRDVARVASIGFYSTQQQWNTITGGTLTFNAHASWLAGASSAKDAKARCSRAGFTGKAIVYTQYPYQGFDANYAC